MKLLQREWREQKILSWAFAGVWIFTLAFLWSPSRDGLEAVYALAFFIPMLLLLPWRKPEFQQYGGWFSVVALAYAGWSCISSLWGSGTNFLVLQWVVLACWLLGSAWVLNKKPLHIDKLLQWFVWLGAATALINIVVFYANHALDVRMEGVTIARAATLVGQVYGVVVLLGILASWRMDCFKCALGISLATLPALAAVGLSQSRGPMLALLLVLPLAIVWLRPSVKLLVVQGCGVLAGLFALFFLFPFDQLLLERGASLRDQIWLDVFTQMRAEPSLLLWGIGMAEVTDIITSAGEYHHAHNAWLDILYRTGVIGLTLAFAHLVLLLWVARRHPQLAPLTLWLLYGCVCLFVDSRSLFWEIDAKWLLYWVPAALLAAQLSRVAAMVPALKKQ